MKTTEAKREYFEMKRTAGHEVRKAKNDDQRKLGESLQGDYLNSQSKFWTNMQSTVKGNQDV